MQLNGNQASVRSGVIAAQIDSGVTREIDLYEELVAFAEMTADEQCDYLNRFATATDKTAAEPVFSAAEEPLEAISLEQSEPMLDFHVGEPHPDSAPPPVRIEAEEPSVNGGAEAKPLNTESNLAEESFPDSIDDKMDIIIDLVESDTTDVDLRLDSDLGGDIMSSMICPSCEAELGNADLFCAECGSFLNGISSTPASSQICGDCSESVSLDELFCPWCGSVLGAN